MRACLILLLALGACHTAAPPPPPHPMDTRLQELLAPHPEAFLGLAYRDLASGRTYLWHASTSVHAASTMKLPVMIAVFREAEAGGAGLETPIPVTNTFRSIEDGASFVMPPDEDSEKTLYAQIGQSVAARKLVELMIHWSSNLATNVLIDHVGVARIQEICAELDAADCHVLRGVQDLAAYRAGRNNTTTALALLRLLQAVHEDRAASPAACAAMREILEGQKLSAMIAEALPEGTKVLSKTGRITAHDHDAAIIHPTDAPPYILVILTKGLADPKDSVALGRKITTAFHRWHLGEH